MEIKQEEVKREIGDTNRLDILMWSYNHCGEIIEQISWTVG